MSLRHGFKPLRHVFKPQRVNTTTGTAGTLLTKILLRVHTVSHPCGGTESSHYL